MSKRIKLRSLAAFQMKAVIICDDSAFAASAASTLARVGCQAGINVKWTTIFWPTDRIRCWCSHARNLTDIRLKGKILDNWPGWRHFVKTVRSISTEIKE